MKDFIEIKDTIFYHFKAQFLIILFMWQGGSLTSFRFFFFKKEKRKK
jgi:hypothetical protein